MGQFDTSLGAFLIGSWINMGLYWLEIAQVVRLFRRYPKDPLALKLMVVASLLVDTACTIAEMATVYTYTVTQWGNPEALTKQIWAGPAYVVTTALSAAIVHGFLIFRFYTLSKQAALTAFYIFCAACALSGGLAAAIVLRLYPLVSQRNKSIITAIVWFTATCTTDVCVAVGLWWALQKMQSRFRSTQSMIDRVSKLSIQTGAITTLFALATLSVFLQNHSYNVADAMNFCLGRVYTHTMLYSLHARRLTGSVGDASPSATDYDLSADRGTPAAGGTPAHDLSAIHFRRTPARSAADESGVFVKSNAFGDEPEVASTTEGV